LIKSEDLNMMDSVIIDYCKILIKQTKRLKNESNEINKINMVGNQKIICNPDKKNRLISIENLRIIYDIIYEKEIEYFESEKKWSKLAWMTRHINNSEKAFKLFDEYSRRIKKYENNKEKDNRYKFFGNHKYTENFNSNCLLSLCARLDIDKFNKYLNKLYKNKYEQNDLVNSFNS